MKKIIYIAIVLIIQPIINNTVFSQSWYDSAEVRIEEFRKGNFGLEIRDELGDIFTDSVTIELINHEFGWGGVIPIKDEPEYDWHRAVVTRFCNLGVTGNYFKWPWIEYTQGVTTYSAQDEVLDWVDQVDIRFRGHTLLWGGDQSWQMPSWTLDGSLTAEEIYAACENHITRDVNYWKGRVDEWDVVNEPSEGHETWLAETVGDSINWNSFKWAHTSDSNAVLYVNDFNIIVWGSAPAYRTLIETMMANGAPIGGIGLQAHMEASIDWNDVKQKLDYMAELGIPLRITEFDMKIDENNVSEENMATYYAMMMRIGFSHPAVNGFVLWTLWDGAPYHPGSGIYDEDRIPKMAADSAYHLIHEQWSTKLTDDADITEKYAFRGFYGDYRITVNYNGEIREFTIPAIKENADSVFLLEYANSQPARANFIEGFITKEGDAIQLLFDKAMDFSSFDAVEFNVYSDQDYPILNFTEIDSVTVQLALENAVYNPNQFYAVYYDGEDAIAENTALLNRFGPEKIINHLPAFKNARTDTTGFIINVEFSEIMAPDFESAAFSITVNGNDASFTDALLDENKSSIIVFTLAEAIEYSDDVRIIYEEGDYRSADGYKLKSFSKYVTNMVPNPNPPDNLNESNADHQVRAYPNPFNQKLALENTKEIHLVKLYSAEGKLLTTIPVNGKNRLHIDTSILPKGFLTVSLLDRNYKTVGVIRLIKE